MTHTKLHKPEESASQPADAYPGPLLLQEYMGVLRSRLGASFACSHVIFRGKNLHTDLKDMGWIELYVYGITGRRFSHEQLRLIEAIWVFTSYPDARIWNNRVSALAGSARSTGTLGVSASLAISEASLFGGGPLKRAISFFIRTQQAVQAGQLLEETLAHERETHRIIPGYGRPMADGIDERLQPLLQLVKELKLDQGPHLRLAFEIEALLMRQHTRMRINYGGLVSALAADLGLAAQEHYLVMFPMFLAGMLPCFIENAAKPEGVGFPTSCADIVYEGQPARPWHTAASLKTGS